MILSIDTSTAKTGLALYWADGRQLSKEKQWFSRQNQSQELLFKIDQFLKQNKVNLKDLKAIGVYRGPGSYTGLRVGITVANTLGWALNIPVIGILKQGIGKERVAKFPKIQTIPALLPLEIAKMTLQKYQKLHLHKFSKIVLPYYLVPRNKF